MVIVSISNVETPEELAKKIARCKDFKWPNKDDAPYAFDDEYMQCFASALTDELVKRVIDREFSETGKQND